MSGVIKIFFFGIFDDLSTLQWFYRVVSTRKTAGDLLYSHQVGVARVRRKRATPMKLMMTQVSSLGWSPAAPMAKAITPALAMEAPTLLQDLPTSRPAPGRRGGAHLSRCSSCRGAPWWRCTPWWLCRGEGSRPQASRYYGIFRQTFRCWNVQKFSSDVYLFNYIYYLLFLF